MHHSEAYNTLNSDLFMACPHDDSKNVIQVNKKNTVILWNNFSIFLLTIS